MEKDYYQKYKKYKLKYKNHGGEGFLDDLKEKFTNIKFPDFDLSKLGLDKHIRNSKEFILRRGIKVFQDEKKSKRKSKHKTNHKTKHRSNHKTKHKRKRKTSEE